MTERNLMQWQLHIGLDTVSEKRLRERGMYLLNNCSCGYFLSVIFGWSRNLFTYSLDMNVSMKFLFGEVLIIKTINLLVSLTAPLSLGVHQQHKSRKLSYCHIFLTIYRFQNITYKTIVTAQQIRCLFHVCTNTVGLVVL